MIVMRSLLTGARASLASVIIVAALGCRGERPSRAQMPADSVPVSVDTARIPQDSLSSRVDSTPKKDTPKLSAPMQQALDSYAPGFAPFSLDQYSPRMMQFFRPHDADPRDPLNQAEGDFNGDGVSDLALYGRDQTRELTIVLLSQPDRTYRVMPLEERPLSSYQHPARAFLRAVPPGPLEIPRGLEGIDSLPPPKTLPHDAVSVTGDGSGQLFYWTGSRFVAVTTGD